LSAQNVARRSSSLGAAGRSRVVPLEGLEKPRVFGRMRGRIRIADDFDAPLPDDILDRFENSSISPEP